MSTKSFDPWKMNPQIIDTISNASLVDVNFLDQERSRVDNVRRLVREILQMPSDSIVGKLREQVEEFGRTQQAEKGISEMERRELEKLRDENSQLQLAISSRQESIQGKKEVLQRLRSESETVETDICGLNKNINEKEKIIFSLKSDLNDAKISAQREKQFVERIENDLREKVLERNRMLERVHERTLGVESQRETVLALEESVNGARLLVSVIKREIKSLEHQIQHTQSNRKQRLDEEIVCARAELHAMREETVRQEIACNRMERKLAEKDAKRMEKRQEIEAAQNNILQEKTTLEKLKGELEKISSATESNQQSIRTTETSIRAIESDMKSSLIVSVKRLADTIRQIKYFESLAQTIVTNEKRTLADDTHAKDEENVIEGLRVELRSLLGMNAVLENGELATLEKDCEMLKSSIMLKNDEKDSIQVEGDTVNALVNQSKRELFPSTQAKCIRTQSKLVKLQHENARKQKSVLDLQRDCDRFEEILTREKELIQSLTEGADVSNALLVRRHMDTYLLKNELDLKTTLSKNMAAEIDNISTNRKNSSDALQSLTNAQFETDIFFSMINSECEHIKTTLDIFRAKLQNIQFEVTKKSKELHLKKHLANMREFKLKELEQTIKRTTAHNSELSDKHVISIESLRSKISENQLMIQTMDEKIVETGLDNNDAVNRAKQHVHPIRILEQTEPEKFRIIECIRGIKNRHSEQCRKIFELKLNLEKLNKAAEVIDKRTQRSDPRPQKRNIKQVSNISIQAVLSEIPQLQHQKRALEMELELIQLQKTWMTQGITSRSHKRLTSINPTTLYS